MTTRRHCRCGAVFIVALGVLTVMIALVFGFLTSGALQNQASRKSMALPFARMAAQAGLAHACYAIDRSYLESGPSATHLRQSWRTEFLPIYSTRVGKNQLNRELDRPFGEEFSEEDLIGKDTPSDETLTEAYGYVNNNNADGGLVRMATYVNRNLYGDGFSDMPGGGMYMEPGYIDLDRGSGPTLEWNGTATPSTDTRIMLDGTFTRTTNATEARYRLRYAVAVDDLSSRIRSHAQGPWIDPGGTPTRNQAIAGGEINPVISSKYCDAYANMTVPTRPCLSHTLAWTAFSGLGSYRSSVGLNEGPNNLPALVSISGTTPQRAESLSATHGYILTNSISSGSTEMHYGNVGAPFSWATMALLQFDSKDRGRFSPWNYTPFSDPGSSCLPGISSRTTLVDCPWIINFPTATCQIINQMFYAYMPQEFHTLISSHYDANNDGTFNNATEADATRKIPLPMINLFSPLSGNGARFSYLGSQVYPGTDPDTSTLLPNITDVDGDWSTTLGADINLNSNSATYSSFKVRPQPPQQGRGKNSFMGDLLPQYEERKLGQVVRKISVTGLNGAGGFAFSDSYFLDIAVAFMQMVSVAQFSWMGETGASWDVAPNAGQTRNTDGTLTLDIDTDGDGNPDIPSRYDSVEELDQQFVNNMGEHFGSHATGSRPATCSTGLLIEKSQTSDYTPVPNNRPTSYAINNNIKSLLTTAKITAGQASLMELVLNDLRMSFFGASPQYPTFTPLDFDDNGTVRASCYAGGFAAADPTTGRGPIPTASQRFSLTGYFVFQKSRHYRIFIRGEVVDMLRDLPLAKCTMEYVYCVDPDATLFDINNQPTWAPGSPRPPLRSTILYQRQHWTRYEGNEITSDD